MGERVLNIFYSEPDEDRWLPFDRYPRRLVRRAVRGKRNPGGMERYFLNLREGLDRIGVQYRANSFRYVRKSQGELIGIIGKGQLLRQHSWCNPIIFGPAVFSHPIDDPSVFSDLPIKTVLVSCEWMKRMYESYINVPITIWAAGINTYIWTPSPHEGREIDVLVYDKIRWERDTYGPELINAILSDLHSLGLRYHVIRYGSYREEEYQRLLRKSRCMIFLVEHETQGFAYLQALSSGVPILAWDRGGVWEDPEYFPDKVIFEPVTSVPYWDDRCGLRFSDIDSFKAQWSYFWDEVKRGAFRPRDYILENLTLEKSALHYLQIVKQIS